jgi:hypothetical protein
MAANSSDLPAWQTAVALMQPTFIRVIDRLRTTLEQSNWSGKYETLQSWPADTTPQEQAEVLWLHDRMEGADEADQADIDRQLEDLPQPVPVYLLHLTRAERTKTINLWELCYAICLVDYTPQLERVEFVDLPSEAMQPDRTLLDTRGEIDWAKLDQKTAQVVQVVFQLLES